MNKQVKRKWLKALRSGEYQQGDSQLLNKNNGNSYYCCLGVLEDIYRKEHGYLFPFEYQRYGYHTRPCAKWSGLDNSEKEGTARTLTGMNDDDQLPFSEIANWIEKNL